MSVIDFYVLHMKVLSFFLIKLFI